MTTTLEQHIINEKPLSYGAMAGYPYSEDLEERMTFVTRFKETVNLSRRHKNTLLIPRNLCGYKGKVISTLTNGTPVSLAVNCKLGPRNDEQRRVLGESEKLLRKGVSHVINASTGFGKTFCGLTLAGRMGLKTLIVVTKADSMAHWRKDALKFLAVKDSDVGVIQQDKCKVQGKKVVVGMIHSLAKEKYPEDIYREFGLVIFDEVHRVPAETFSTVAGLFHARLRLGLSATTSRIDGKEFVYEAHIGPVMVASEFLPKSPKVLLVRSSFKLPMVPRKINGAWKTVPLPHEAGKLGGVVKLMANDDRRNRLIASLVAKAHAKGRWVVVMSELSREKHLDKLFRLCASMGVPANDMGFYVGGMTKNDLEKAKTKHVVFVTYGMTAEATDVPWWDTLVFATPRSNIIQPVGRIVREYEGKPQPIVFDIVDGCSVVLLKYAKHRIAQYQSSKLNGTVVSLKRKSD